MSTPLFALCINVATQTLTVERPIYTPACRSRNPYTSVRSTPGTASVGSAASSDELMRACARAAPDQRAASCGGASRQHDASGQVDVPRRWVSRPRNHFTCANGVPTEIEKSPDDPDSMREVHQ